MYVENNIIATSDSQLCSFMVHYPYSTYFNKRLIGPNSHMSTIAQKKNALKAIMNNVLLTSPVPAFEYSTVIEIYLPSGIYTRIQIILNGLFISNVG